MGVLRIERDRDLAGSDRMRARSATPHAVAVLAQARIAAAHRHEQMMPFAADVELGLHPGERVLGVVLPVVAGDIEARHRRYPAFLQPEIGAAVLVGEPADVRIVERQQTAVLDDGLVVAIALEPHRREIEMQMPMPDRQSRLGGTPFVHARDDGAETDMDHARADALVQTIDPAGWKGLAWTVDVRIGSDRGFPPVEQPLAGKARIGEAVGLGLELAQLLAELAAGVDLDDAAPVDDELRPVDRRDVVGGAGDDAVAVFLARKIDPRLSKHVARQIGPPEALVAGPGVMDKI